MAPPWSGHRVARWAELPGHPIQGAVSRGCSSTVPSSGSPCVACRFTGACVLPGGGCVGGRAQNSMGRVGWAGGGRAQNFRGRLVRVLDGAWGRASSGSVLVRATFLTRWVRFSQGLCVALQSGRGTVSLWVSWSSGVLGDTARSSVGDTSRGGGPCESPVGFRGSCPAGLQDTSNLVPTGVVQGRGQPPDLLLQGWGSGPTQAAWNMGQCLSPPHSVPGLAGQVRPLSHCEGLWLQT